MIHLYGTWHWNHEEIEEKRWCNIFFHDCLYTRSAYHYNSIQWLDESNDSWLYLNSAPVVVRRKNIFGSSRKTASKCIFGGTGCIKASLWYLAVPICRDAMTTNRRGHTCPQEVELWHSATESCLDYAFSPNQHAIFLVRYWQLWVILICQNPGQRLDVTSVPNMVPCIKINRRHYLSTRLDTKIGKKKKRYLSNFTKLLCFSIIILKWAASGTLSGKLWPKSEQNSIITAKLIKGRQQKYCRLKGKVFLFSKSGLNYLTMTSKGKP